VRVKELYVIDMIDALFGSKTRVKLLHLFLNNVEKSFYVREITRIVDEQINSVRRELANMLKVGIITSDTANHRLYYKVNQSYEHYEALRAIFSDKSLSASKKGAGGVKRRVHASASAGWEHLAKDLPGVRVVIAAGSLVHGSSTSVDLLVVSDSISPKLKRAVQAIEKDEGRDLNYSLLPYEEFYYRMSIHDKFITEILSSVHAVVVDADNVLKG
jgi:predicted transcriptional regulator